MSPRGDIWMSGDIDTKNTQMKKTQIKHTQRSRTLTRLLIQAGQRMDGTEKPPEQVRYMVREILGTCKDLRSRRFYYRVAAILPDVVIFRFLAEIRQDPTIQSRGAVFSTKVRGYLEKRLGKEEDA